MAQSNISGPFVITNGLEVGGTALITGASTLTGAVTSAGKVSGLSVVWSCCLALLAAAFDLVDTAYIPYRHVPQIELSCASGREDTRCTWSYCAFRLWSGSNTMLLSHVGPQDVLPEKIGYAVSLRNL